MKSNDIEQIIESVKEMLYTRRLVWVEHSHKPIVLRAAMQYDNGSVTPTGLRDNDLLPVQEWCLKTKCGVRISFDMFKFKSRKEVTAFLLVWG